MKRTANARTKRIFADVRLMPSGGRVSLHAVHELYAATNGLSTLCFVPIRTFSIGISIMTGTASNRARRVMRLAQ
jgi:hypothetical protein